MNHPQKVAIYGAGGFAREVAWLLSTYEKQGQFELVGYIEDGAADGRVLNNKPVFSWQNFTAQPAAQDTLITVAVGNPQLRKQLVTTCTETGFRFATLLHHSVEMSEFVQVGNGCIICCGSILTVNIHLGQQVHINLDCTVGHDVHIGDFSTLSPGVHVSGHVHIGTAVYIGTGATIINGTADQPLVIADGTVIGAGACVTQSTEAHSLYAGVPAQLKKRYSG